MIKNESKEIGKINQVSDPLNLLDDQNVQVPYQYDMSMLGFYGEVDDFDNEQNYKMHDW